jgi:hypothetical protein
MLQVASQTLPYPRTAQPFIGGGLAPEGLS